MSQSFDPVFGEWYTEKQIGCGTDGKVYTLVKTNPDGSKERSVLKTIRIGSNRSESRDYNAIGEVSNAENAAGSDEIIENITENIGIIQASDNGRHFVKYEQCAVRETSDGKGRLILIRLEQMRSLASLLNDFSFTLEETLRLGVSVCRSLMKCREFGYIYPNVKPENILFDRRGVCKLGDFGSFSCLEPSKTSIAFKRTQYYMAPEFIKNATINCTADTYSLGLVLYSLVNRGRLPFTEEYPQEVTVNGLDRSMKLRLAGEPLEKPALCSDALFEIIKKACAFKESDRYLSPKQMLADLENAISGKPFAKAEYEDIYSVSDEEKLAGQEKSEEESAGAAAESSAREDFDFEEEEPREPISLLDEIPIPDVTPGDYASARKPKKEKAQLCGDAER